MAPSMAESYSPGAHVEDDVPGFLFPSSTASCMEIRRYVCFGVGVSAAGREPRVSRRFHRGFGGRGRRGEWGQRIYPAEPAKGKEKEQRKDFFMGRTPVLGIGLADQLGHGPHGAVHTSTGLKGPW